jgi:Protein of unknown function (DUF2510)/HIRAN domain
MGIFKKAAGQIGGESGLVATPVWGPSWPNADVVGESNYSREIHGLMPSGFDTDGDEVTVDVLLSREANNKYDKNAVAIRAATGTVGYLPREEATRYAPILDALTANGRVAQTTARVWGYMREEYDSNQKTFVGSVRVSLPEPHMMFPANQPPVDAHALLPIGSAIQVTGEEGYRENLAPWLNARGETWVYATLHAVVEASARSSKALAEVRIDGRPVGRLTPKMSQDMLPAVKHLAASGLETCVRAIVKGNALKADVVLHTARAGELPSEWLSDIARGPAAAAQGDGFPIRAAQPAPAKSPDPAAPAPPMMPPANWYPDPQGHKRLRYWDGAQWTEHTAD